jgi:hypothetical protein
MKTSLLLVEGCFHMLGAQGLWAGRNIYHAAPDVTLDLGFFCLTSSEGLPPFSRLFTISMGHSDPNPTDSNMLSILGISNWMRDLRNYMFATNRQQARIQSEWPKDHPIHSPLTTHKGMASWWVWDRGHVSKQVWHDKEDLDPLPCSNVLSVEHRPKD